MKSFQAVNRFKIISVVVVLSFLAAAVTFILGIPRAGGAFLAVGGIGLLAYLRLVGIKSAQRSRNNLDNIRRLRAESKLTQAELKAHVKELRQLMKQVGANSDRAQHDTEEQATRVIDSIEAETDQLNQALLAEVRLTREESLTAVMARERILTDLAKILAILAPDNGDNGT